MTRITIKAESLGAVRFRARCEGEEVELLVDSLETSRLRLLIGAMERRYFDGQPYWYGQFDDLSYIFPSKRTDSADKVDFLLLDFDLETRQSLMEEAYNEMLRGLDKRYWGDEWEIVIQQCMPTYEREFERRQKERAHEVVNQGRSDQCD